MIKLIVLDVDGCLTNGAIIYTSENEELKAFNVKDGLAIKNARKLGFETAIITGRDSKIVAKRAKELEISFLFQGVKDKFECLEKITQQLGITMQNVAGLGDDLNDLKMLKACGLSATPKDGSEVVAKEVDIVLNAKGGEGAAREYLEYIFKSQNLFEKFVDSWL